MCPRKILINKFLRLDDSKNYLIRETAPYDGIVEIPKSLMILVKLEIYPRHSNNRRSSEVDF